MKSFFQRLLPPENREAASWYQDAALPRALPTRTCVTTISVILYCVTVGIFLFLKTQEAASAGLDSVEVESTLRANFGYRNLDEIWNGKWWGLFSAASQHFGFIHLAFNMLWLYRLGTAIERAFGSLACLGLILGAAFVSSGFQMAVTVNPLTASAGMSGVVYAMAGFLWTGWRREPGVVDFFNASTARFFLGWQVLCFLLTWSNIMPIANTAHLSGLAFGLALGALVGFKGYKRLIGANLATLMIFAVVAMLKFGAPWSPVWHAHMAYRAHVNFRLDEAAIHYQWLNENAPRQVPYLSENVRALLMHKMMKDQLDSRELRELYPVRNPFIPRRRIP